jgi:hypothetical protein
VAIHPRLKEGVYRIEVNGGETRLIVRKGEAQISTPQGSTNVEKGQAVTVRGSGDDTQYKVADAPSKDSWDSWVNDRNGTIRNARSWNHTNQYYTGAEDLDAYGSWQNVPDYGYVWAPVAPVGWAPYRDGRWVWEPYWGWTWVSYEPWGWAPYHYGRWFVYGGSWVWWPGPVYGYRAYRPVWAPAYVSFFGFGSNFGFAFGFGNVGWLPIGPCDYYYPWYGRHRGNYNVVNITNITIINNNRRGHWGGWGPLHTGNRYSNLRLASTDARIRESISTVPTDRFGRGGVRPTPYKHEGFKDGGMITNGLPLVPSRQSLSASDRPASPSTIRGGQHERFFTKSRPAARPESFDKQVTQLQQDIQRSGRFGDNRPESRSDASAGQPGARMNNPAMNPRTPRPEPGTPAQPRVDRGQDTPARGADTPVTQPGARMNNPAMNPPRTPRPEPGTPAQPRVDRGQDTPARGSDAPATKPGARMNNPAMNPPRTPRPEPATPAQPKMDRSKDAPPQGVEKPRAINNFAAPSDGWRRFGSELAENRPPENPQQSTAKAKPAAPAQPKNAPPKEAKPAAPDQSGWRRFSDTGRGGDRTTQPPDNRGGRPSGSTPPARSTSPVNTAPPAREAQPDRNDGWRHFTPQPGATTPEPPSRESRGNDQWNRFPSRGDAPPAQNNSREMRPPSYGDRGGSRPPLDLRRPIVTPRPSPRVSGPSHRGGESRPEPRGGGGNRGGSGSSGQPHSSPPNKHR